MSISIILICLWGLAANVIAMLPSRDYHWRSAYILMTVGVPILGYVVYEHGYLAGLIAFLAACSILRWPLIYLSRWMRRVLGMTKDKTSE